MIAAFTLKRLFVIKIAYTVHFTSQKERNSLPETNNQTYSMEWHMFMSLHCWNNMSMASSSLLKVL